MAQKVLIIDDEEDNLVVFRQMLEREGFAVATASSSADGLLAAVDSKPDLILCDVVMPDGNGVSVCRRLRNDERTKAVPIILMSGVHKGSPDQVKGIEQGADDYLPKPFSPAL